MTPQQLHQISSLLESLRQIQDRMARSRGMFPNHYSQLQQQYNQLLTQARGLNILPPWMIG